MCVCVSYTYGIENDNKLPFLDILVTLETPSTTNIYRKNTISATDKNCPFYPEIIPWFKMILIATHCNSILDNFHIIGNRSDYILLLNESLVIQLYKINPNKNVKSITPLKLFD